ncbi:putative DNA-binding transcriptional regulator [Marinomonas spartinae]|uniref:Putative DNA-binding transcriptional regulator n=1 Tax=Marinomonas spartinae TaxID=1792290 RepID=A0A1A8TDL2_9GAMM|nr:MurR/RpiR family transcriptional regulator [Marinomonas spartinae]SBS29849.1 putative DNA-binding transcriptional regulator [Marinomonas spartinae]SBS37216.1 putative DNA-binding transcriptional regulator [Marinomonas spartinae]
MSDKSIEHRIKQIYDQLSPTQQKLAACILNHQGDIATYSATELAKLADVSKSAVTRLLQRLGYKDFTEVKKQVRAARRWGAPIADKQPDNQLLSNLFQDYVSCDQNNIRRTLESINTTHYQTAIRWISRASKVYIIGYRNNHALALHLRQQLIQCRPDVQLLPLPGQTLGEEIVGFSKEDIVIIMGVRRRPAWLKNHMITLRQNGCRLIYITDHADVNPQQVSDLHFSCVVRGVSAFDSYASVMNLISMIASSVYQENYDQANERIEDIENTYQALNELDMAALNNGAIIDDFDDDA